VAYAVPSNNNTFPKVADLASFYDSNAQSQYQFFSYALSQIQCEAGPTAQYSLNRTCADCESAYKSWLCSVTIPRCEDFSNNATWLQPRAVFSSFPDNTTLPASVTQQYPNISAFNSSRNPLIDANVSSGPYKEVLPCEDVCYNLVQSCPAALGFACARPGYYGFNTSYGLRTAEDDLGVITCNYPGSAHFFSDARRFAVVGAVTSTMPALLVLLLLI
jgi:calcium channel MID1